MSKELANAKLRAYSKSPKGRIARRESQRKYRQTHKERARKAAMLRQRKYRAADPEKTRAMGRAYYAKNAGKRRASSKSYRERHPAEFKAYMLNRRRQNLEAINAIKLKSGCRDCGYNAHPAALDFDHVRGRKIRTVSQTTTLAQALSEIAKCEIRCANCHRIATANRGWRGGGGSKKHDG